MAGSIQGLSLIQMNAELAAVETNLFSVADTLESPLSDLVRAQIRRSRPFTRAAVVLAAGFAKPDNAAGLGTVQPNDEELQAKRIYLASALEMLYVALGIHKLLLVQSAAAEDASVKGTDASGQLDKTIIGSTILAGDYCFSRSAAFAAQTDNPKVVALFAAALKDVSEGHLRHVFGHQSDRYEETAALCEAGIRAVSLLTLLPEVEVEQFVYFLSLLSMKNSETTGDAFSLGDFPPHQQDRWQYVSQLFISSS